MEEPIAGYDPERNVTYRWVTQEKYCQKMASRYGWKYKGRKIDPNAKILKVRCTFEGKAELPQNYTETDRDSNV